jgi:hypothetical protein
MLKVLVFPAGTEIGLEIYRQLRFSKNIYLIGATSKVDHAEFLYENVVNNFPSVYADYFLEFITDYCIINEIDILIPAHDEVIFQFAKLKALIKNTIVMSPELELAKVLRHKSLTYLILKDVVKTPQIFSKQDLESPDIYPVFIKPNVGQGSKGCFLANNKLDIQNDNSIDFIYCEYLPGVEISVDCFSISGNLLIHQARQRLRINNGISVKTEKIVDYEISQYCVKISKKLKMHGPWFVQFKKDKNGEWALLEVAARIAGSSGLTHLSGFNLMEAAIYNMLGYDIAGFMNSYHLCIDRALDVKCKLDLSYEFIYIDLDDTIIINGKVNSELIAFIYKSINLGQKVILITRHKNDITNTLLKYRLQGLFDQVIHITDNSPKSRHIEHMNSILIDDSFSERKEVFEEINIPVLSPSMAVLL